MTFDELTRKVAKIEGKNSEMNIAQIKEVTRIILTILCDLPAHELGAMLMNAYKRATNIKPAKKPAPNGAAKKTETKLKPEKKSKRV